MASHEAPQFGDGSDWIPGESELLAPPEADQPGVDLRMGEVHYQLKWKDTLVRQFLVGDGEYDHLIHNIDAGTSIFLFFGQLQTGDELKEMLAGYSFPIRVDPILDEQTINFYSRVESGSFEDQFHRAFPES